MNLHLKNYLDGKDPPSEQEILAHRVNSAINTAIAFAVLVSLMHAFTQLCPLAKKWCLGMLGFVALWLALIIIPAASQSTEDYVSGEDTGASHGWLVFAAVMAGICLVVTIIVQWRYETWLRQQQPPAASAVPAVWQPQPPTPPPAPRATQTVVERSVRVVRAPSATTTHHNTTTPPTASQSPHNVIAPPLKQLTVVTGRSRPSLHTEDHGSYRSYDRRSFDRDTEEGPA